jgi:hypothetical protein
MNQSTYRPFSEYRHHDYRTPRSVKEAYGWDAPLYVIDDDDGWMNRRSVRVTLAVVSVVVVLALTLRLI